MNYFDEIVSIISEFLGPASERFVRRQVEFHIDKDPEKITKNDLPTLAYNVSSALALLTEDNSQKQLVYEKIIAL